MFLRTLNLSLGYITQLVYDLRTKSIFLTFGYRLLHDQIRSILGYFLINTGGSEVSDVTKHDS